MNLLSSESFNIFTQVICWRVFDFDGELVPESYCPAEEAVFVGVGMECLDIDIVAW